MDIPGTGGQCGRLRATQFGADRTALSGRHRRSPLSGRHRRSPLSGRHRPVGTAGNTGWTWPIFACGS